MLRMPALSTVHMGTTWPGHQLLNVLRVRKTADASSKVAALLCDEPPLSRRSPLSLLTGSNRALVLRTLARNIDCLGTACMFEL